MLPQVLYRSKAACMARSPRRGPVASVVLVQVLLSDCQLLSSSISGFTGASQIPNEALSVLKGTKLYMLSLRYCTSFRDITDPESEGMTGYCVDL